ncbi:MAG: TraR/DksA C4-type zinc finger protein [Chitinophagaceae bacterium]|nr:TraR/DksA C4-type zinc finger protein [Chitinophagaceae bacterium]
MPKAKAPAKPVVKKPAPAKKEIAKPASKKPAPVKKVVAKPVPKAAPVKKVAPKAAPKPAVKASSKPVAKAVAKAAPKAKVAAKEVKPVAKSAVKATSKQPATKVVAKTPAKPAPKPVAKPVVKPQSKTTAKPSVPAKPEPKVSGKAITKEVKKVAPKPEPKKVDPPKPASRPAKKSKQSKTTIVSTNSNAHIPKKSDVFKTNTFGVSNLKNESGKVIAHRKTSELKRKTEDTEQVKKYEPEATRSILEMNDSLSGPSYRYSDEELQEFRELILRKLETAKAELQYLQGVIMRKDEGGTEDTENKYQNMEDGSASMEREQFNQLASRQITFIGHLEQALVRIENKTYGICRETGKLIDKARLRAVPHATLSIEAKNAKKN